MSIKSLKIKSQISNQINKEKQIKLQEIWLENFLSYMCLSAFLLWAYNTFSIFHLHVYIYKFSFKPVNKEFSSEKIQWYSN